MHLILEDFLKILPELEKHIDLAGGNGFNEPILSFDEITFNGRTKCGHEEHDLGITWPSENAGGVAVPYQENAADGSWFAGATLQKRMCDGDCSHETFYFPRIQPSDSYTIDKISYIDKDGNPVYNDPAIVGLYFDFCKTAFKPYDLAVITILIIAKRHLKDFIFVSSDGQDSHWFDGKMFCQVSLGYGLDFFIDSTTGYLTRKEVGVHEKAKGSN
ncbi:MAG: hypothetical protein KGJ11_00025 [Candidatus Omnitrophica bacterium]|nr:hypothetical protein [Candidatus Omnitrophota bacterium]